MAVSTIALGLPASIVNLIQQNALERVFHENLFPRLLYRSEATPEQWAANLGEVKVFTRPGLVARTTAPLTPGTDPLPQSYNFEQWIAEARQYGNTIDTHMPTSSVSLASLFLRNIQELGKGAGLSINGLARNALFRSYLGGNAMTTAAVAAGAFTAHVSSIAGFTEKLQNGRPQPVSALNPLDVTFTNAEPANQVVAAVPDNAAEPFGPGTLQFAAALTVGLVMGPPRTGIRAANRTPLTIAGGGATVDALTSANVLSLQDIINGVARMRANNVPPTADGYYHVHVTPEGEAQLFNDQQFRQLYQSLPDSMEFRDLAIGQLIGCRFYRNAENPSSQTVSVTHASGASALAAPEIGGEIANQAGLALRYCLILGGGSLYEPYIDESRYISEAGVTGKIGEFSITNGGVQVMTERIRLSIRSPLDRLQQVVAATWSWSGDFAVPSDELTGSPARYKRGAVICHA